MLERSKATRPAALHRTFGLKTGRPCGNGSVSSILASYQGQRPVLTNRCDRSQPVMLLLEYPKRVEREPMQRAQDLYACHLACRLIPGIPSRFCLLGT